MKENELIVEKISAPLHNHRILLDSFKKDFYWENEWAIIQMIYSGYIIINNYSSIAVY